MRNLRVLALIVLSASVAACATLEDPPNAPRPLSLLEAVGEPGVLHSNVIAARGETVLATGPVSRGQPFATIPYRYRHTAVLTEDVVGHSITVSGVQAPSGAPGYYAGRFQATGTYASGGSGELWCFLPGVVGGDRQHLCFLRNMPGLAAIAPTRMNPYLWTQFAPATGSFDYVRTPIYERRAVEIPGDLTLEYRFRGWTAGAIRLTEFAAGREVRDFDLPRRGDGTAVLRSIAGDIRLAPAPGDADRMVATRS